VSPMHRLRDFTFLHGLTTRSRASGALSVHATRSVAPLKGAPGGDYCRELRPTSEWRLMTVRSAPPVVAAQIVTESAIPRLLNCTLSHRWRSETSGRFRVDRRAVGAFGALYRVRIIEDAVRVTVPNEPPKNPLIGDRTRNW
jgi:hypothetical protein